MAACLKTVRMVFVLSLVFAIILIFTLQVIVTKSPVLSRGFLVDTSACRILDLDPFDSSTVSLVRRQGKIQCSGQPSITYEEADTIRINRTVINAYYKDFKHCKYKAVFRGLNQSDFHFTYGDFKQTFTNDIRVTDGTVKVYCFSGTNSVIYINYHSLIIPNKTLDKILDQRHQHHLSSNKPKEVLNVLMVGVDSVSRLNSIRQMPLTRKFLLEELGAIELLGYTKVALNTFVNIVPMTTGKFVGELPSYGPMKSRFFDKYNFIWKNFSHNGYRTLYAEDAPGMGIFTYLKAGFLRPPTDHYNRVFSDAVEKDASVWNSESNCIGDRLETDTVLKYVQDFSLLYRDKPRFGFAFVTRITHGDLNSAGGADDPHLKFLRRMSEKKLFDNTVLIYFSDHGMRFGKFRDTLIGKLEDRLPFMFFVFPQWFKKKYPNIIRTLKINTRRLTTPFDIYETLKDILYFDGELRQANVSQRGISLFKEVPRDRSCDHAALLPQWCVCLDRVKLQVHSTFVQSTAKFIVREINKLLLVYRNVCAKLKLKEIKSAVELAANSEVDPGGKKWYDIRSLFGNWGQREKVPALCQVTLITTPGGALFETTVSFDHTSSEYSISGDINRINKYGNQSSCIDDFYLRNYCLCE